MRRGHRRRGREPGEIRREGVTAAGCTVVGEGGGAEGDAEGRKRCEKCDFVNRLLDDGTIAPGRMKRNFVHSVSDDVLRNQLGLVTKMAISRTLLLQLRDAGRAAMDRFLAEHRDKLGRRSSVDLEAVVTSPGSVV